MTATFAFISERNFLDTSLKTKCPTLVVTFSNAARTMLKLCTSANPGFSNMGGVFRWITKKSLDGTASTPILIKTEDFPTDNAQIMIYFLQSLAGSYEVISNMLKNP
jgi:hypothetical protein